MKVTKVIRHSIGNCIKGIRVIRIVSVIRVKMSRVTWVILGL
jgi:hypothetical protein